MTVHRSARVTFILVALATLVLHAEETGDIIFTNGGTLYLGPAKAGPLILPDPIVDTAYQRVPFEAQASISATSNGNIVVGPNSLSVTGLPLVATFLSSPQQAKSPTLPFVLRGMFNSLGTSTGAVTISPLNTSPTTGSVVVNVVPSIVATPLVTFSPQPVGTTGSIQNITLTNKTPEAQTVTVTINGATFSFALGANSESLTIPAGGTFLESVAFDRLGGSAAGTYTGRVDVSLNGGTVASTDLSGTITPLCSLSDFVGNSYAGSIHGQAGSSLLTPLAGLLEITVNNAAGNVGFLAALDSPTATAQTPVPAPGKITVNPDCSFTADASFGTAKGFLTPNGKFAAGLFESDGTDPFLSPFGNQPVNADFDLQHVIAQIEQESGEYVQNALIEEVFGPGAFLAQGSISSTPTTFFYDDDIRGVQSFSTGVFSMSSFNSFGFASGVQTGPGGLSLLMSGLQFPDTGEIRFIANEPGSSSGALVDGSLNPPASAPASGLYVLNFEGVPSNPSLNQATVAEFAGNIVFSTQFNGFMEGNWLSVDITTGTVSRTPMTVPIQAGSSRGTFFLDASNASTLPGHYDCQTNADTTVRCINEGQTSPSLSPVPFVTSVTGHPQAPGPYSMDSAAGTYIVSSRHFSQLLLVQPDILLNVAQLTLVADGSVGGIALQPGAIQGIQFTGHWSLDPQNGSMLVSLFTPTNSVKLSGIFSPTGETFLRTFQDTAAISLRLSK